MSEDLPIIPIGVRDAPFTLDLVARDCPPTQFLREFTVNGIEAVAAYREHVDSGFQGEVVWTIDPIQELDGRTKLSCVDTGIGMTAEEMPTYLNDLASSGKPRGLSLNYGLGAKVSAAVANPRGVIYMSWHDGRGHLAELGRDRGGVWGMRQHRDPGTGNVFAIPELDNDAKPLDLAALDHGTAVTFLGETDDQDTTLAVKGEKGNRWIAKNLNQRFFELPDWITVKVREIRVSGTERKIGHRVVRGQRYHLDQHTIAHGTHRLDGARVHWRILADNHDERAKQADVWASTGHRACLFQGELFELATAGRGGYEKLKEFGIRFGYERVVLYVEPVVSDDAIISQDTVRTQVKIDGEPLPWAQWAQQFDETMPAELRNFQEEIAAGAQHRDHSQTVRERLANVADLFRIPRYRPQPDGPHEAGEPNIGGMPGTEDLNGDDASRRPRSRGGSAGNVYALFERPQGPPATEVAAQTLPEIKVDWVSISDGTRAGGEMEDRAAQYDRRRNYLQINADFRAYQDVIDRWVKRYSNVAGAAKTIEDITAGWWQQALEETILGVLALRGSQWWDERSTSEALSEVSLTAAAMQRYHLDAVLKRELAQRLGGVKQAA